MIDNVAVMLVQEETVVNLCNTYMLENNLRGEQVIVLDPEAPISLAGRPWLEKYLAEFDYNLPLIAR